MNGPPLKTQSARNTQRRCRTEPPGPPAVESCKQRENTRKVSDRMSSKRKPGLAMRIVACVLILASAAMFLLPWMGHSLTVEGRTGTIDSLLE